MLYECHAYKESWAFRYLLLIHGCVICFESLDSPERVSLEGSLTFKQNQFSVVKQCAEDYSAQSTSHYESLFSGP